MENDINADEPWIVTAETRVDVTLNSRTCFLVLSLEIQ